MNLVATSSGSTVTLTWGAPTSGDPVATYGIEAGSAPGLSNLAVVLTNSTATTFTATGVANGTYYVRVRAANAANNIGPASNEVILVVGSTSCTSAPGAPTGLTNSVIGGTVTLNWNAPSGGCPATSYILQAGATSGSSALANSNVGNVASYVATGVGAGTYYVRVVAANAFGQSPASNEVVVTVGVISGTGVTGTWRGTAVGGKGNTGGSPLNLFLQQTGTQVTGTWSLTNSTGTTLSSSSVSGSVSGTTFTFSTTHTFDVSSGCGLQLTNGNAQVTGTTMQGTLTIVNDVSQQCGTTSGSNTFDVSFTLTKQ